MKICDRSPLSKEKFSLVCKIGLASFEGSFQLKRRKTLQVRKTCEHFLLKFTIWSLHWDIKWNLLM